MRKCRNCGARFTENVNFCSFCGAPIEKIHDGKLKWAFIGAGIIVVIFLVLFLVWNFFIKEDENAEPETQGIDIADVETSQNYDDQDAYDYWGQDDGRYILEESDKKYISEDMIRCLSDRELMLARNEIYARKGRIFDDEEVRKYFMSQSWYDGTIHPDDFTEDMLSEVEKANVKKIRDEEERRTP